MLTTEVLTLNRTMAAKFLESSAGNRPIKRQVVDAYTKIMKRGEWLLNGEGIQFDYNGRLLNGHHRCHAVIKSGVSLQVLVVRGCAPESFKTHDGGAKRSAADILAINGEINAVRLSSAARALLLYHEPALRGGEVTPTSVSDCVDENPELRYWTKKFCSQQTLKRFPSALIAMTTVASEKYGPQIMETFLDKLATGVGLEKGDPALLLRERFLTVSEKRMRLQQSMVNAIIIKAINAHIKGKTLGVLRYSANEAPPVIE